MYSSTARIKYAHVPLIDDNEYFKFHKICLLITNYWLPRNSTDKNIIQANIFLYKFQLLIKFKIHNDDNCVLYQVMPLRFHQGMYPLTVSIINPWENLGETGIELEAFCSPVLYNIN